MPFLLALGLALILTPAARFVGRSTGLVDRPTQSELKIHARPVPVLGGVSVLASTFVAASVVGSLPSNALVAAVLVALLAGVVDDVRPVAPPVRVALLVGSGIVLALGSPAADPGLRLALPVLVLVCANAVNLVDGQDGLAGGLGAIAALGLAWLAARSGQDAAVLGLALAGALVGFLVWNRPPARIYLGNGGAYAVGTVLASMAGGVVAEDGWRGLLAAGACLTVFAFELVFTVFRRVWSGRSLVRGDRLHSYDLMAARGRSRAAITLAFCGAGVAAAGLGSIVGAVPLPFAMLLSAAVAFAAGAVGLWLSPALGRR